MQKESNNYSTKQTHDYLLSLMKQGKFLELYFYTDEEGYDVLRIQSEGFGRFDYRLSVSGFKWIMNYIIDGIYDDRAVSYDKLFEKSDSWETCNNENFEYIYHEYGGIIKQDEEIIKDNSGKYRLRLKYPHGMFHFMLTPDDKIIAYMKSLNLKV